MDAKIKAAIALRSDGFSIKEISARLDVHVRTVSKWFNRHRTELPCDGDVVPVDDELQTVIQLADGLQESLRAEISVAMALARSGRTGQTANLWRLLKSLDLLAKINAKADRPAGDIVDADQYRDVLAQRIKRLAAKD